MHEILSTQPYLPPAVPALRGSAGSTTANFEGKADIFPNRHVWIKTIALENHGNIAVLWFQIVDLVAVRSRCLRRSDLRDLQPSAWWSSCRSLTVRAEREIPGRRFPDRNLSTPTNWPQRLVTFLSVMPAINLSFYCASGQPADNLALEKHDQHEQEAQSLKQPHATANITFPLVCVVPRKLAILGTMVWFSLERSIAVTAKSL